MRFGEEASKHANKKCMLEVSSSLEGMVACEKVVVLIGGSDLKESVCLIECVFDPVIKR